MDSSGVVDASCQPRFAGHLDMISRGDAARWLDAGLMDLQFYAALRSREFDDPVEAMKDFIDRGMPRRLSPHPFLDFASLPPMIRQAWRARNVAGVLEHLTGEDGRVRPAGPLEAHANPDSARASMLALARTIGLESAGVPEVPGIDWSAVRHGVRQKDLTTVVMVAGEPRRTIRSVEHLLDRSEESRIEVVVVDPGSAPHVALGLHASLLERAEVQLLRLPGPVRAGTGMNIGVAHARGESLVLLQPHVVVRRGWLPEVLAALDDPDVAGVQPVVLRRDDTVDSAGLGVTAEGRAPLPLLAGHPKEDARRLQGQGLAAISCEAMVLRTQEVVALEGLEPGATHDAAALDLCARLLERHPGGFRVAPAALVTSLAALETNAPLLPPHPGLPVDPRLYERIGFTAERRDRDGEDVGRGLIVTGRRETAPGQLRWSLKLPSAAGPGGDRWGDTHFANALAKALRGLGQDVVTRRRGAHTSGPTHLDDVALAVRGLYPISPTPGQVNVLWVISHPDDVQVDEFDGYDLVFAASHRWSQDLSARLGREVVPLLQASEFEQPVAEVVAEAPGVVFVGAASPQRERPLVWQAVEAGVPLTVYGPGWESLPPGIWRGDYVENTALPELYRRHGIVLADHWPDMARHGFIANRVFDAVASGARVICDDVVGVHEVFDPRDVVVARTPDEIAVAVDELGRPAAGGDIPRPTLSFDDRARVLLARVTHL